MPQSRLSRRIFTTFTCTIWALVALLGAPSAPAPAVETWDGGGADDLWSTDANWADDTAPTSPVVGDGVFVFTGSEGTSPVADAAQGYAGITGITFDNGAAAFTVSGQTLTLDDGWINNTGLETQTIQNNLTASASSMVLVVNADAGDLVLSGVIDLAATSGANLIISGTADTTLSGVIAGAGGQVTKTGAGTATLSGTNTYTGDTTISGGTLVVSGGSAIADTGAVVLDNTAGARLQLNSSETVGSISGGGADGGDIDLGANTLTVGDATDTTYEGVISGAGGSIVKQGSGTLTLNGANTYTGGTTLNAGTLAVGNDDALGTGTVTLNAGTIQASGGDRIIENDVVVGGNVAVGDTGNHLTLGSAATTVNLGAVTRTITTEGDLTIAGSVIGTAGGLTKAGAGTLTLSGTNLYVGTTTVSAGTLVVAGGGAILDTEAVVLEDVAGAGLELQSSETIGSLAGGGTTGGNVNLDANTLTIGGSATTTYAGSISGTGGLTKAGAGTQTLSGTNTYTGTTTINGGTLAVSGGSAIADAGAVVLADTAGAQVQLNTSETIGSLAGGGTTGGNVVLGANTLTVGDATDTTYNGAISGTNGKIIKQGTGALTLGGTSSYTGGTTLSAGTLGIGANAALGTGTLTVEGGAIQAVGDDRTIANNVTLNADLRVAASAGNTLTIGNTATVNLGSVTRTLTTEGDLAIAGGVVGTGATTGLTKDGAGTLTLAGSNLYSGQTTVAAGTLEVSGGAAILDAAGVQVNAGASFALRDDETANNETIAWLTGEGDVLLNDNTLTVSGTTDATFEGVLSGTGGLTKGGSGALTLTGTSTYSGATLVTNGALVLNGALSDSDVEIRGVGASLAGTGTAGGDVSVNQNGRLDPAGEDIGALTIMGDLTVTAAAADTNPEMRIDVDAAAGTQDEIAVGGAADIGNNVRISFTVANPQEVVGTTRYAFLTADEGITIDLTAVTTAVDLEDLEDISVLRAILELDEDENVLSVRITSQGVLTENAEAGNHRRIARGLETLIDRNPSDEVLEATEAIASLNEGQLNTALDQRSPAAHFSAFMSNIVAAQTVNTRIAQELRTAPLAARLAGAELAPAGPGAVRFAAAATDPYVLGAAIQQQRRRNNDNFLSLEELAEIEEYRPQDMTSVFGGPVRVTQNRETEGDFLGYESITYGLALGVRRPIREDVAVGLAFAYDSTNVNFNNHRGGSDIDTVRLGPLVSYRPADRAWFVNAAATYGFHMFDTAREVTVPAPAVTAEADYNAHDGTIYIEGGADFEVRGWLLTPMASLQYMHLYQESFSESGGGPAVDLDVDSQSFDSLLSRIGITASYPMDYASMVFIPEVGLGWQHEFLAGAEDVTANFAGGGGAFTIQTGIPNRDGVFYSGGMSVLLDDTKSVYFRYDGLTDGNGGVSAFTGGFVLRF